MKNDDDENDDDVVKDASRQSARLLCWRVWMMMHLSVLTSAAN